MCFCLHIYSLAIAVSGIKTRPRAFVYIFYPYKTVINTRFQYSKHDHVLLFTYLTDTRPYLIGDFHIFKTPPRAFVYIVAACHVDAISN